MKLFGYKDEGHDIEQVVQSELAEITLVATPSELRKIAEFLQAAAKNMERMGNTYNHEHLSDKMLGFEGSPHFVVFRSD